MALAISLATLVLGALIGFFFRRREFEREQRVKVYGEFVATFLEATYVGAAGFSVATQLGEGLHSATNRETMKRGLFNLWADASLAFEAATSRLRLIASKQVREQSEILGDFIRDNVRAVPPFTPDT